VSGEFTLIAHVPSPHTACWTNVLPTAALMGDKLTVLDGYVWAT
jgi:hypothetical protein